MENYKTYSWEELLKMDLNKDELAKKIGIECAVDMALPQDWLNSFTKEFNLDYQKVRYSTFTTYPKDNFGYVIVSAWDVTQEILDSDL